MTRVTGSRSAGDRTWRRSAARAAPGSRSDLAGPARLLTRDTSASGKASSGPYRLGDQGEEPGGLGARPRSPAPRGRPRRRGDRLHRARRALGARASRGRAARGGPARPGTPRPPRRGTRPAWRPARGPGAAATAAGRRGSPAAWPRRRPAPRSVPSAGPSSRPGPRRSPCPTPARRRPAASPRSPGPASPCPAASTFIATDVTDRGHVQHPRPDRPPAVQRQRDPQRREDQRGHVRDRRLQRGDRRDRPWRRTPSGTAPRSSPPPTAAASTASDTIDAVSQRAGRSLPVRPEPGGGAPPLASGRWRGRWGTRRPSGTCPSAPPATGRPGRCAPPAEAIARELNSGQAAAAGQA